jgi:hypothetical protein
MRRHPGGKETTMKVLPVVLLLGLGLGTGHAASCNLPSGASATSATYSGKSYGVDDMVTKVSKCALTGLTWNGDTSATFQFDGNCGPLPVNVTMGFATRLTKNGKDLGECSAWQGQSDGSLTVASVIKTDPTTGAPTSEKGTITAGFSGTVFIGKFSAKY